MLERFMMWLFRRKVYQAEVSAARMRYVSLGEDRQAYMAWRYGNLP